MALRHAAEPDYTGPDAFTYTIYDSHGAPLDPTTAAPRPPWRHRDPGQPSVAGDDEAVLHGIPTESLALLVNDRDPDDDPVALTGHTDPIDRHPRVQHVDCRYVPPVGVRRADPLQTSFNYTVGDGRGLFDTADVKITLLKNLPPHAEDDRGTAQFGASADDRRYGQRHAP